MGQGWLVSLLTSESISAIQYIEVFDIMSILLTMIVHD